MIEPKHQLGVGLFLLLGLVVFSIMVFMIGKDKGMLTRSHDIYTQYSDIRGLKRGAPVELSGIHVGYVKTLSFVEGDDGTYVLLRMNVISKYFPMIREDSTVTITTKGVLGDKYVQISVGTRESAPVKPGGFVKALEETSLIEQISSGTGIVKRIDNVLASVEDILDQVGGESRIARVLANIEDASKHINIVAERMTHSDSAWGSVISRNKNSPLNKAFRNIDTSSVHLKGILKKVDEGEGTVGALINDPTLFEDLKVLFGGAKRNALLKFMVREALKQSERQLEKPSRTQAQK